jgi:hypothetical protein
MQWVSSGIHSEYSYLIMAERPKHVVGSQHIVCFYKIYAENNKYNTK